MKEFDRFHPLVNAAYFLFAVVYGCLFLHPAAILLLFVASFSFLFALKGAKYAAKRLLISIPAFFLMAALNPLFNHDGVTILCYLPSKNPLTAESILYGLCFSGMLIGVLTLFSCFYEIMTSDKMLYLTGRVFPTLSLILSMSLRFVPELSARVKRTANAQKCIGRDTSEGNMVRRAKNALAILSIVVTYCLENAVDIADSMRARGYGLSGRTSFSIFVLTKRDRLSLTFLLLSAALTAAGTVLGYFSFTFFPSIKTAAFSPLTVLFYIVYGLFLFFPSFAELLGVIRWRFIRSET